MTRRDRMLTIAPLAATLLLFAALVWLGLGVASDPDFALGVATSAFVLAVAAWAVLQTTAAAVEPHATAVWLRPRARR